MITNNLKNFEGLPLMDNNINEDDVNKVIDFLKGNKKRIFTQSKKVREFESKWSKWLGVKYSVFVNSGSSANLLSIYALKILKGDGEIIVPTLTWALTLFQFCKTGSNPVFVDINPRNLCMDENQIIKK